MMEYNIFDASNDFASLSNDVGKLEEELCRQLRLDPTSQDFRLVFLDSIQQYVLSLTAYIRAFVALQQRVSSTDEFLKILNVGLSTVEEFESSRIIYKFPIESLITMIHFQIDSFFDEVCRQAGTPCNGFYNRMTKVLEKSGIESGVKNEFQNTLQCLAFFRNSFHDASRHAIHKSKWSNEIEPEFGQIDRVFSKDNCRIQFKHGEEVTYNWKSAFLLIQETVRVMQPLVLPANANLLAG